MSIVRPDESTINDCIDIICKGFEKEYTALFRIPAERLKPFVKLSIQKGDCWALVEDEFVKGVLIVDHPKHHGASLFEIFKVLFKTIPLRSAIFASRYVLAPRVRVKESVHIDQIAVDQKFRNQGVGTRLLEFAQKRAAELGFETLNLRVRADNPAFNLYKRFGFEIFKEVSSAFFSSASGCKTAFFMIKHLVP